MDKQLKLTDFDILGVITLQDVEGIEKYVTKFHDNKYFSRSKEYYNVKTLTELSEQREELKKILTREFSKRNFVILENMLNCSAKVYFKKFENHLLNPQDKKIIQELELAKQCLNEDTENILKIIQNKGLINVHPSLVLPKGDDNSPRRAIEMDNKAMLYLFAKTLDLYKIDKDIEILTPGYGSIYIGPFLKAMYGCEFTNMLQSKYIDETITGKNETDLRRLLSSGRIYDPNKTILLLDDNIGTGQTMKEIKEKLKNAGISNCISGAVQYNWRNYYRVSIGEKTDIDRFDVNEFEILSPLNYAGHKLYKHAIDTLHSSGKEYENYLNSKSYRKETQGDIKGALLRGLICARRTGLELNSKYTVTDPTFNARELKLALNYQGSRDRKLKPESVKFIEGIINNVCEVEKNEKEQNHSKVIKTPIE